MNAAPKAAEITILSPSGLRPLARSSGRLRLRGRGGGHEPRHLQGRVRGRGACRVRRGSGDRGLCRRNARGHLVARPERHPRRAQRPGRRRPQGQGRPLHRLSRLAAEAPPDDERDLLQHARRLSQPLEAGQLPVQRDRDPGRRGRDARPDHSLRAARLPAAPGDRDSDGRLRPDDEAAHRDRKARRGGPWPASGSTSTSTPARARTTRSSSRSDTRRRQPAVPTSFTRKLSNAPLFAYAYVEHYRYAICSGASSAPAGCASQSTDGLATDTVKVTTTASLTGTLTGG